MSTILYLIIWPNGHEEKLWVKDWQELTERLNYYVVSLGLPDLIYRKE